MLSVKVDRYPILSIRDSVNRGPTNLNDEDEKKKKHNQSRRKKAKWRKKNYGRKRQRIEKDYEIK